MKKIAISLNLAKKVFDIRAMQHLDAKAMKSKFSNPYSLVDYKTGLEDAKNIVNKMSLDEEKAGLKSIKALNSLHKRESWGKNIKEYGKRNPSLIDKIKTKASNIFGSRGFAQPGLATVRA